MDEGILLVYPDRILAGDVPLRDFETFYGPTGFYLIAAERSRSPAPLEASARASVRLPGRTAL
jgi:hypothetical protein